MQEQPRKAQQGQTNSNKKNHNKSELYNKGTKNDQTKKLKVLVAGDSQLRFVDESKLTNAQIDQATKGGIVKVGGTLPQ